MADHSVLKSLEKIQYESLIICLSFKKPISGLVLEVEANILPIFFCSEVFIQRTLFFEIQETSKIKSTTSFAPAC